MASMYCVKCRAKKEVDNPEEVTMKNVKPALKAKCPTCGTGMYKIGKKQSCIVSLRPSFKEHIAKQQPCLERKLYTRGVFLV